MTLNASIILVLIAVVLWIAIWVKTYQHGKVFRLDAIDVVILLLLAFYFR